MVVIRGGDDDDSHKWSDNVMIVTSGDGCCLANALILIYKRQSQHKS